MTVRIPASMSSSLSQKVARLALLCVVVGAASDRAHAQCARTAPDARGPKAPDPWRLMWSDEFNVPGLPDSTKWRYDVGGDGWGNQELQYYTARRPENARVENGH